LVANATSFSDGYVPVPKSEREQFLRGAGLTSLGGLISRIIGMGRDVATAALLGTASGVLDCFVFGFQVPQFARRLFGDGAQSATYLPILSQRLVSDRDAAWELVNANLGLWLLISTVLTVFGEAACFVGWWWAAPDSMQSLAFRLTAIFLPYMIFLCTMGQAVSTLHALGKFGLAVLCTIWVNVIWLITAGWIVPTLTSDSAEQAMILAVSIVGAAALQCVIVGIPLFQAGYRWSRVPLRGNPDIRKIVRHFVPAVVGMGTTQANTMLDTLTAWIFTSMNLFGIRLGRGAVAALYLGERLFMFPVGLVGQAIGTAIFPMLSRHAARGERDRVCEDMVHGLRIVVTWGIPASLGLIAMSRPIAVALYRGGEFTLEDAQRTGDAIAGYGGGVWAFSALAVLVRGCYALSDYRLPTIWGLIAIGVNLVLNVFLLRRWEGAGLAMATAIAACIQAICLSVSFSKLHGPLPWRDFVPVLAKSTLSSAMAIGLAWWLTSQLPEAVDRSSAILHVGLAVGVSLPVYVVLLKIAGVSLWRDLKS
jgi:putative peptidoglycan lipid II flippase